MEIQTNLLDKISDENKGNAIFVSYEVTIPTLIVHSDDSSVEEEFVDSNTAVSMLLEQYPNDYVAFNEFRNNVIIAAG
jgi:hypothetical protein